MRDAGFRCDFLKPDSGRPGEDELAFGCVENGCPGGDRIATAARWGAVFVGAASPAATRV
jgi:hypothetical protein